MCACKSPRELTVLTKKTVKLNEPVQVGFMIDFNPTKMKLKKNSSFKILDEPRVISPFIGMNLNMINYIILPLESGKLKVPKCIVYDGKQKYKTESFVLEISNDVLDSISSKILLKNLLSRNLEQSNSNKLKTAKIEAKFNKIEYQKNDTIQITFFSDEIEFYHYKIFDFSNFKKLEGKVVNSNSKFTNGVLTKSNSVKYFLMFENGKEPVIPSIDTIIGNNRIISDEVKIKVN